MLLIFLIKMSRSFLVFSDCDCSLTSATVLGFGGNVISLILLAMTGILWRDGPRRPKAFLSIDYYCICLIDPGCSGIDLLPNSFCPSKKGENDGWLSANFVLPWPDYNAIEDMHEVSKAY